MFSLEGYTEWIVKKKASLRDKGLLFGAVLGAILVSLVVLFFALPTGWAPLGFLLIAAVWYGIYRLTGIFHVEYEYIMTDDEMDVDRITDKRSRKHVLSVSAKNIEMFRPFEEEYLKEITGELRRVDVSSGQKEAQRYFIVAPDKEGKKLFLIFEPNEKLLERFSHYNPRNVICK